jgi:GMP synthase-like glutamine amidotransferase
MKFLILRHIDIEGPGTFGDFLNRNRIPWDTVELDKGGRLPPGPAGHGAVVVLGGPMNVYEEDKYPFLRQEDIFIKECINSKIPYLGFCLGAQLLAKAAGADVVDSPVKEIGWYEVSLTGRGAADPLFKDHPGSFPVFQWHSDMFNIPQGGILLATGSGCRHQAFRFGENAYGLQFHIEITGRDIAAWHHQYAQSGEQAAHAGLETMLNGYSLNSQALRFQSEAVYANFLSIAD